MRGHAARCGWSGPVELLVEVDGRMLVHARAGIVQYPMSMFLHRRGVEVLMYWEDGDRPLNTDGLPGAPGRRASSAWP